jgi:hypothetical protein
MSPYLLCSVTSSFHCVTRWMLSSHRWRRRRVGWAWQRIGCTPKASCMGPNMTLLVKCLAIDVVTLIDGKVHVVPHLKQSNTWKSPFEKTDQFEVKAISFSLLSQWKGNESCFACYLWSWCRWGTLTMVYEHLGAEREHVLHLQKNT